MGLLDRLSDPLGTRYKKRSWNETLGITSAKRKINKALIQPFSKLNPMWHYRNFKRNTARKLGYNSEIAKAYRSGAWGTYMKRKLFNSAPGVIMPFRESQYTPYDLQSNPFDRDQTGPTKKGIFHKLSKYAAPGAVIGLSLLARKYHMANKFKGKLPEPETISRMTKIKQGGKELLHKLHGHASRAYGFSKEHAVKAYHSAKDTAKIVAGTVVHHTKKIARGAYDSASAKWDKILGKTSVNSGAPKSKQPHVARMRKKSKESTSAIIMPFMESYGMPPAGQQFYQKPKSSFISKVATAGLLGVAAVGGVRAASALLNQRGLAVGAAKAAAEVRKITRETKGMHFSLSPSLHMRRAMAQTKLDLYRGAAGTMGMFRSSQVIKDANRAAKMVTVRSRIKSFAKYGPKGARMPHLSKHYNRHIRDEIRRLTMEGKSYGDTKNAAAGMYFNDARHKVVLPKDPTAK